MNKRPASEEPTNGTHSNTESTRDAVLTVPTATKRHKATTLVDEINALTPSAFISTYIPDDALFFTSPHATNGKYNITFTYARDLPPTTLESCLALIAETSKADYQASTIGWNPRLKKKEMLEPEMRYLLVSAACASSSSTSPLPSPPRPPPPRSDAKANRTDIPGFLSFMITHDSVPAVSVLYIYEIQLKPSLRGLKLGKYLLDLVMAIARKMGLRKVMLTCFVSNRGAFGFYQRLGYVVDVCSPGERRTRGRVVKPDYVIMSKDVESIGEDDESGA